MKNVIKNTSVKTLLGAAVFVMVFTSCQKDEITSYDVGESVISENADYKFKGQRNLQVETFATLPGVYNDGVTVDWRGNIYVSEFGQFVGGNGDGTIVSSVSRNGNVSEFGTDLSGPLGSAFDYRGNFYVIDNNNGGGQGDVLKITPDGTKTLFATIEGFPSGLAFDYRGNLYVSNFTSPTIFKINRHGKVFEYVTDPRLTGTVGIDFDRRGNLVVGNFVTADILSINRAGNISLIATIPDISVGGSAIGGIEVVGNSIFATGISVNKVFRVTMQGEITVFAGNGELASEDGALLEASFFAPNRIEFDRRTLSLYISQYGSNGLRKIRLY